MDTRVLWQLFLMLDLRPICRWYEDRETELKSLMGGQYQVRCSKFLNESDPALQCHFQEGLSKVDASPVLRPGSQQSKE